MINIKYYFILFVILLNIANLTGFIIGKLNYKNENNTKFIANLSLCLVWLFISYTLCLLVIACELLYSGHNTLGLLMLLLTFVPFILGKSATYKKADLFINLQIIALTVNMLVICASF